MIRSAAMLMMPNSQRFTAAKRLGEARYSPAQIIGTLNEEVCGSPEPRHVCTSHVWLLLHFMHYNYCRIHQTTRVTLTITAGLTDHVWKIQELVGWRTNRDLVHRELLLDTQFGFAMVFD
jgi:hypothetical protein